MVLKPNNRPFSKENQLILFWPANNFNWKLKLVGSILENALKNLDIMAQIFS